MANEAAAEAEAGGAREGEAAAATTGDIKVTMSHTPLNNGFQNQLAKPHNLAKARKNQQAIIIHLEVSEAEGEGATEGDVEANISHQNPILPLITALYLLYC